MYFTFLKGQNRALLCIISIVTYDITWFPSMPLTPHPTLPKNQNSMFSSIFGSVWLYLVNNTFGSWSHAVSHFPIFIKGSQSGELSKCLSLHSLAKIKFLKVPSFSVNPACSEQLELVCWHPAAPFPTNMSSFTVETVQNKPNLTGANFLITTLMMLCFRTFSFPGLGVFSFVFVLFFSRLNIFSVEVCRVW